MSKTVSEFFGESLTRLGFPTDHEGLKSVLAITATIPDDVTEALNGLMTEKEAKQNLTVKNYFMAQFGDGISSSLQSTLTELGLDPALIDEIKGEKSTGKKVSLSLKKLAEAKEALIKAKADKDPEAITKANEQIKAANELLSKREAEWAVKFAEKENSLNEYKQKNELAKLVSAHTWSDIYPEGVRDTLFNASLQAEAARLGAKMVLEGDKLVLKQAADPQLTFHHQNKEFTASDLVAKVMTDNKFIAVAPKATEPQLMTGSRPINTQPGEGGARQAPNNFSKAMEQSLADQGVQ